jgi:acyl carrier protein
MVDVVWERLRGELETQLGLGPASSALTLDSRLRDDLGLGSLKVVDLVVKLEDAYDIAIADDELPTLVTVRDLVELIRRKIALPGGADGR